MRFIMLNTLDHKWKDHLLTMDHLKDSIGLRGYAGKDPQQEYSREGFELFQEMYSSLEREVVARMFRVEIRRNVEPVNRRMKRAIPGFSRGPQAATGPISTRRRSQPKVGRNDPCPCGSGKKYKKCCMKKEAVA
jgi:preprotein translocase subunit SecA